MASDGTADLIQEFLGSAHIFSLAVKNVVEERLLSQVAGKRLTFGQFKLLRLVTLSEAQGIRDVATFLGVSNAAASKAVDKLVRRRFLRRAGSATDRRTIQLSLTEQGRRVVAAYDEARKKKVAAIFREFRPERLRRTADLLDRLSAHLVDHGAKPEEICLQCGVYFRERCLVRELVKRNCFYLRNRKKRGADGDG
jgi:DNA-binding MarR family transcriptional regulator